MRGYFRSRDKDGGHIIRSAIAEKPPAARKLHGSYCRSKFYVAGIAISTFVAPVTLTLTAWPLYTNLTGIPSS